MIPLLTIAQIQESERLAVAAGKSESDLMREAGAAIASEIEARRVGESASIVVLCGPGKNGGDGLVAACHLMEYGWSASVWAFERDGVAGAPVDRQIAKSIVWLDDVAAVESALEHADITLDAVFGVGGRATLPDDVRAIFSAVQRARRVSGTAIWAVDVPSGVDADSGEVDEGALEADVTAMIGLPKIGAYQFPAARHTGEIVHVEVGLEPPEAVGEDTPCLITESLARASFPSRRAGAHKRSVGTVLVVAGGPNFYGAPRLASEAALRSGAGLVTVAAPAAIVSSVAIAVPEVTFLTLPSGDRSRTGERMAETVRESMAEYDALLIGPGLGLEPPVPDFLASLFGLATSARASIGFGLESSGDEPTPFSGRAVVDADGLNWLAKRERWWESLSCADLVLTPHPKELSRLLDCELHEILKDPWGAARRAASTFGQVVVLKHGHSVVAMPDGRLLVVPQSMPALATAGTGDVLAGIIASFCAQGLSSADAAASGLLVGLEAAEHAASWRGQRGLVASDLVSELPHTVGRLTEPRM